MPPPHPYYYPPYVSAPNTSNGSSNTEVNNSNTADNATHGNTVPPPSYYPMIPPPGYGHGHGFPGYPPHPYAGYYPPHPHAMHPHHSHSSTSLPISAVSRSFDKGSQGDIEEDTATTSRNSNSNSHGDSHTSRDDEDPPLHRNKKSRSAGIMTSISKATVSTSNSKTRSNTGRDEAPYTPREKDIEDDEEDDNDSNTCSSLLLSNSNSFTTMMMDSQSHTHSLNPTMLPRRMNCSSLDSLSDVASIQEPLAISEDTRRATDTLGVSDASAMAVKMAQKQQHMKNSNGSSKRPFSSTTSAFQATNTFSHHEYDEKGNDKCKERERAIKYNSSPLSIRSHDDDHIPRTMLEIPAISMDHRDSFSRDGSNADSLLATSKILAPKPYYPGNAALYFRMSYDDDNDQDNQRKSQKHQRNRPGSSMSNSTSAQSSVALRLPTGPSCSWEMGSSSDFIGFSSNAGLLPSFSFTNDSQSGFLDAEARQKSHSFESLNESISSSAKNGACPKANEKQRQTNESCGTSNDSMNSHIENVSSSSSSNKPNIPPHGYYPQPYYGYPPPPNVASSASAFFPPGPVWYPMPGSTSKSSVPHSPQPNHSNNLRNESRGDRDSPVNHPQAVHHHYNGYSHAPHYTYDHNYAAFCPPPVELPRHNPGASNSQQHRIMTQNPHDGSSGRVMPPNPKIGGVYNWSKEEDVRLTFVMKKYRNASNHNGSDGRDNWDAIAKEHGRNKSGKECHERWIRYLKPGVRKGQWQDHEDAIVVEAVTTSTEQPFTRWSDLAQRLPGRVGKQIRDRWVNHLNPSINHMPFSKKDDRLLYKGYLDLGKKWVEISSKYFNSTRSENHIKNRWYSASFKKFITQEFGPEAYNATSKNNSIESVAAPVVSSSPKTIKTEDNQLQQPFIAAS